MTVQDLGQVKDYRGQLGALWICFEVNHLWKYAHFLKFIPKRRFDISICDIQGVLKDINLPEEKNDGNNRSTLYYRTNIHRISGGEHRVVAGTEYTFLASTAPTSLPTAPADQNPLGDIALFHAGAIGEISNGTFTAIGGHRVTVQISPTAR